MSLDVRLPNLLPLVLLAPVLGACPLASPEPSAPFPTTEPGLVSVVASLPPLGWVTQRVGGARVEVSVLFPPGVSPHAYEPSLRQAADLERADLLVVVGHPRLILEERVLAGVPSSAVRVALAGDAASSAADDPHLWLDPNALPSLAWDLAEALSRLDPAAADGYHARAAELAAESEQLRTDLDRLLSGAPGSVLVDHVGWQRLLAPYGIVELPLEIDGRQPTPRRVAELIEIGRAGGARAVFAQRGEPTRGAQALADELGAEIVTLDPLAADWPDNLRRAATEIRRGVFR